MSMVRLSDDLQGLISRFYSSEDALVYETPQPLDILSYLDARYESFIVKPNQIFLDSNFVASVHFDYPVEDLSKLVGKVRGGGVYNMFKEYGPLLVACRDVDSYTAGFSLSRLSAEILKIPSSYDPLLFLEHRAVSWFHEIPSFDDPSDIGVAGVESDLSYSVKVYGPLIPLGNLAGLYSNHLR